MGAESEIYLNNESRYERLKGKISMLDEIAKDDQFDMYVEECFILFILMRCSK